MRKLYKVAIAFVGVLALLAGVGWAGLQVESRPFSPAPQKTRDEGTVELPKDLPEPVRRHFLDALGPRVPKIETAVVWGRGEFNLMGVWFPMRFKSYHVAGQGFRRDLELTWFSVPIFRGYDSYIDGKGRLEFTGLFGLLHISDGGPKIDQGDNLAMWAEAPFTTPSVLVLDPRVRWEPEGADSARLVYPFGEGEESMRVEFGGRGRPVKSMSGMRYRGQEGTKTPYRGEYEGWGTIHGIDVPGRNEAIWEDQGRPYVILDIEGTEYNVDVSEKIPR